MYKRTEKYPVNSYIPQKVTERTNIDLHLRLEQMTYNEIMNNLTNHFENCYVTNFDIIHNQCRGDKMEYSEKFYKTIFLKDVNKKLFEEDKKKFIESALRSERDDLNLERDLVIDFFKKEFVKEKFEKKGIFLSSMRKKFCNK